MKFQSLVGLFNLKQIYFGDNKRLPAPKRLLSSASQCLAVLQLFNTEHPMITWLLKLS